MIQPRRDALDAPTVLISAEGEKLGDALAKRLRRLGITVEETSAEDAVQTAFVTAPDLVVLAGAAAADGGQALLERLCEHHATSMLPVVLIGEGRVGPDARAALRHGIVAIVERTSNVERMAQSIAALAIDLPERTGESAGLLGEQELAALVELLTESHRFGLLSVTDESGTPLMHMVLRGDRPVEESIAELAARLKVLDAAQHGPLRYEFHESNRARVAARSPTTKAGAKQQLSGRRIVLVERNAARADALGQTLRKAGSQVVVATGVGEGLDFARELLPEVIVVDEEGIDGWAAETLKQIRRDPLLCWASLLVIDGAEVWRGRRPDISALSNGILELIQPDLELITRVRAVPKIDARLEVIGPARTLRALAVTGLGLKVSIVHPRVRIELELIDGMLGLVTARPNRKGRKPAEGLGALATLLHLPTGRVSIVRASPSSSHVMVSLDEALASASELTPEIPKSAPPPPGRSSSVYSKRAAPEPVPAGGPEGSAVSNLVDRLEQLLGDVDPPTVVSAPAFTEALTGPAAKAAEAAFGDDDEESTATWNPGMTEALRKRIREERERAGNAGAPAADPSRASRREPTQPLGSANRRRKLSAPDLSDVGLDVLDELEDELEDGPTVLDSQGIDTPAIEPRGSEPSEIEVEVELEEEPSALGAATVPDQRSLIASILGPGATPSAAVPPEDDDFEPFALIEPVPDEDDLGEAAPSGRGAVEHASFEVLESLAGRSAPEPTPASVFDVDPSLPDLPTEEPPKRGSRLGWTALVVSVVAFGGGGGGAWWIGQNLPVVRSWLGMSSSEDSTGAGDAGPSDGGGEPSVAQTGAGPGEATDAGSGAAGPDAAIEASPSGDDDAGTGESSSAGEDDPATAPAPGPDDPIEGRAEDFDLSAWGVAVQTGSASRSTLERRARRLLLVANRERARDRHEEAKASYLRVLALSPQSVAATVGLVRTSIDLGDARSAILFAQRLCRLRPAASSFVLLADAFLLAENTGAARRALQRALSIDRRHRGARRRMSELPRSE